MYIQLAVLACRMNRCVVCCCAVCCVWWCAEEDEDDDDDDDDGEGGGRDVYVLLGSFVCSRVCADVDGESEDELDDVGGDGDGDGQQQQQQQEEEEKEGEWGGGENKIIMTFVRSFVCGGLAMSSLVCQGDRGGSVARGWRMARRTSVACAYSQLRLIAQTSRRCALMYVFMFVRDEPALLCMRLSQRSLMDAPHVHSLMRARRTLWCVYSIVLRESSLRLTSKYESVCHCLSAHGWTPHTRTHACCPCLPSCWPCAVHVTTHMETAPSRVHCPMKDGRDTAKNRHGCNEPATPSLKTKVGYAMHRECRYVLPYLLPIAIRPPPPPAGIALHTLPAPPSVWFIVLFPLLSWAGHRTGARTKTSP